jgi:U6 snRNA-associated Sm-like protein LSm8
VVILTTDGRCFVGTLKGYDYTTNIILAGARERVITPDEPTETIDLGLYLLRGESVAVCGLVEEDIEKDIDWSKVSIDPWPTQNKKRTNNRYVDNH